MKDSTISDISLNENEYCTLATTQRDDLRYYKVKILKLMPYTVNARRCFNSNILVNSGQCRPVSANYLDVQDFITVERSYMCDLSILTTKKYRYIKEGTMLKCRCINGNYKNLTIVDV